MQIKSVRIGVTYAYGTINFKIIILNHFTKKNIAEAKVASSFVDQIRESRADVVRWMKMLIVFEILISHKTHLTQINMTSMKSIVFSFVLSF